MNRKSEKNLIVGLDIGTSKIVAIVGEHEPGQPVEIMGLQLINDALSLTLSI